MQVLGVGPIPYRTKTQFVYCVLREAIVSGKLPPGTCIVIKDIAQELGTSGIPVREAIRTLEAEGLVEVTPHVGPRVARISVKELAEVLPVRAKLEAYATQLAASRSNPGLVPRLLPILDDMRLAVRKADTLTYGKLNMRFHMTIYESCGNEYLRKLIADLWEKTERVRSVFTMVPELLTQSLQEHEQMVRLLRDGRGGEIEEFAYQHKTRAFDCLLRRLEAENQGGDQSGPLGPNGEVSDSN